MTDFLPGDSITETFYHKKTGLTDSDFTKTLFKNGLSSTLPVTVTELGSGFYKMQFTTDSEDALWELDVIETGKQDIRHQGTWRVKAVENANITQSNAETNTLNPNLAYIRNMVDLIAEKLTALVKGDL